MPQSGRRLLARDRQLCCELLLWVFLDSCELDIVKQSLIEKLYLWEPPSPPSTDDERKKHIDNSICGPPTQLTNLEADESSAWTREEVGIPVWRVEGETRETSPGISSPARMVTTNSWVGPSLVPDVIVLDDAHVADQQRRLLRFVSQALDDPKVLVFRGFAPAAEATEEERHLMEADKHRFRFYLSVLKMLKLMVADGMYAPDYILPPKPRAEGRPSEAKSKSGRDFRGVSERSTPRGGGGGETSTSMARRPSIAAETVAEVTTRAVPVRELELLLLRVLYRSEPQVFLDEPDKSKKDVVRLLRQFYTKSTEADVIVVEAKVEVCLILQLLYDMYTDHRVKALVARCTRRCTRLGHAPTLHTSHTPHLTPLQVQGAVRHSRREQAVAEGGAPEVRGVPPLRQA